MLELGLGGCLAEVCANLVDVCAICSQAGSVQVSRRVHAFSEPLIEYAPVGETVSEVATVQEEYKFTGLNQIRSDLSCPRTSQ